MKTILDSPRPVQQCRGMSLDVHENNTGISQTCHHTFLKTPQSGASSSKGLGPKCLSHPTKQIAEGTLGRKELWKVKLFESTAHSLYVCPSTWLHNPVCHTTNQPVVLLGPVTTSVVASVLIMDELDRGLFLTCIVGGSMGDTVPSHY